MAKEESVDSAENEKENSTKKPQRKKRTSKHSEVIKKLRSENKDLKELILRKTAEFDNFKKRTEKEFYNRVLNANEKLITNLLPILDDMERSLDHSSEAKEINSLIEGIELIYKKLLTTLEKEGLKKIESKGDEFNPDLHDALMQMENKDLDSGKIVDEHLKGYTLNEKVIRHSQVIVAK